LYGLKGVRTVWKYLSKKTDMEFRILGYILIALCPAAAGWLMSLSVNEEVRRLEGIIELISFIKYEICERMSTQQEAFSRFEHPALSKCGFISVLRSSRVEGNKSVLTSALESYGKLFLSFDECERIVRDFAESLGKLPKSVQAQKCDGVYKRLSEMYERKREKTAVEAKLYRSMGTLAGAFAVLLLL